jgi:scyllo-inositol 2-dehydrogenase (NADP+)
MKTFPINTAIIGFGLSGQAFHAPFILSNPGFKLCSIVTSQKSENRRFKDVKFTANFEEILRDPSIELVIIATPDFLHFEQAKKALLAGKHVIVEKPFTTNSQQAEELIKISHKTGKQVFPYQNRRFDSDFLTIKHLISEGYFGEITHFESRFERYSPEIKRAAWKFENESGGLLFDLGIHLIDQAVQLFGMADGIYCRLFDQRKTGRSNDSFDISLIYKDLNVSLSAGLLCREPAPRFIIHGTKGSFIKYGTDMQETRLRKGILPHKSVFGDELRRDFGILNSSAFQKEFKGKYPSLPGSYMSFFENVFEILRNDEKPLITTEEALYNIRLLEAAKNSHKNMQVADISHLKNH